MKMNFRKIMLFVSVMASFFCATSSWAQSSGSIEGVVKDATGGVLSNATVQISNPVTGFHRETTTGGAGDFRFANIPFNPYHLAVTAKSFAPYSKDVDVRAAVPMALDIALTISGASTTIEVSADAKDLIEVEPTFHTDVDRSLFDKLPLESQSSSVSSLVTLASPGIAADANGLFHGMGDHAENSF